MLFRYTAISQNGRRTEGELEAESESQLLKYLSAHELQPIQINTVKTSQMGSSFFGAKITLSDKVFLTRYLSLMLRVGTDLLAAVNILIGDFKKDAMKNFLLEVKANLSNGRPFYEAFARYPNTFSPVFINLVKAAESSGNLQQTFDDLSVSLQKESELRKRIKGAFVYPIILLVASLGIFLFLSLFALPRIAKVFSEADLRPPVFSRVVFAVGLFFGEHVIIIMGTLIALIIFSYFFFGKTSLGRKVISQVFSQAPIIRSVYRDLAVQRFASTFGSLIKAGIPIIDATKITADVVGAENFRQSLLRVAEEGLAKGLTIGESFRRETVFPSVVGNLIAISEKAGHIEEVLATLADFYASNVDDSVKTLVTILEPLLLLTMGLLVAVIAIAIIIPIYQLTSNF